MIIPTQSRAHMKIFYVLVSYVCTVQSINARRIHQSGKCTLYLYNNKYMRTCACLNTNSDRIPIQLIKMHVNGDGDFDDGFCGYEIFPSSYRRRLFSTEGTRLRARTFKTRIITRILCIYVNRLWSTLFP